MRPPASSTQGTAEDALARAIRTCGRTGFEEALWTYLHGTVRADNLVVLAFRSGIPPLALWRHSSEARAFAQIDCAYLSGAYLLDPIYELHLNSAPPGAYRLSEVAPDAFGRSRYYDEYFRQTTILDEIAMLARPRPGLTLCLSLGRDASSGRPYSYQDIARCRRTAPVVAALAGRHWSDLPVAEAEAPDVAARMAEALRSRYGIHLSPRQAEVAMLILRGHSSVSIGLSLGISPQTAKVFRRQLYQRCNISSQAELFGLLLPVLQTSG